MEGAIVKQRISRGEGHTVAQGEVANLRIAQGSDLPSQLLSQTVCRFSMSGW